METIIEYMNHDELLLMLKSESGRIEPTLEPPVVGWIFKHHDGHRYVVREVQVSYGHQRQSFTAIVTRVSPVRQIRAGIPR